MKYIDAEKLKAEIERLKDRYGSIKTRGISDTYYQQGRLLGYEDVIVKIDSLQQEQPELSNEFEIAINRRLNLINGENLTVTELLEETKGMAAELLDLARKVIEKEQPSLPSNLDEAANNYGVNIRLGYPRVMDETDKYIYNAFKAGAEWMAGQGKEE